MIIIFRACVVTTSVVDVLTFFFSLLFKAREDVA